MAMNQKIKVNIIIALTNVINLTYVAKQQLRMSFVPKAYRSLLPL